MEAVVLPEWSRVSARFPSCDDGPRSVAVTCAASGARGSVGPAGCTVSGLGHCAGGGDHAVELLSPGFFSATLRCAPASSWSLGVLCCRWSCARSSPPLLVARRRWWRCWLLRIEDAPGPGEWLGGGGFGRLCPDPVRCVLGAGRRPMGLSSSQIQLFGAGGYCGYQRLWLRARAAPSVRLRLVAIPGVFFFPFGCSCVCSCSCYVIALSLNE